MQNNYLKVGKQIECGNCKPEKYIDCKKSYKFPQPKCECVCHESMQKETKTCDCYCHTGLISENHNPSNCPFCYQPPQSTQESWEKEFDEKYCRKNRNPEKRGEPMEKWFFPEELTPFEVKSFIRNLLSQSKQETLDEAIRTAKLCRCKGWKEMKGGGIFEKLCVKCDGFLLSKL